MNYWSWNWEDIFVGVWADSVLSYVKVKPFWERRTVLLPQIFRLKTWQRDPIATTDKHIRKTKVMMLWAIESNDTFLASHQTLIPPLEPYLDWQQTSHWFRLHPIFSCLGRSLLILQIWTYRTPSIEMSWCSFSCLAYVMFVAEQLFGPKFPTYVRIPRSGCITFCNLFGFQILGCTKWILTCRITSTLEDGWHPHTNCRQPLMEWTKQKNKPTISDRSRWKDAGLLSGGEIWMGSMSSIPVFVYANEKKQLTCFIGVINQQNGIGWIFVPRTCDLQVGGPIPLN